jgi:hypothetical protein
MKLYFDGKFEKDYEIITDSLKNVSNIIATAYQAMEITFD